MIPQVYVDLDGVLADFDGYHAQRFGWRPNKTLDNVEWETVRSVPGFYARLPMMPDAAELWVFVQSLKRAPIILTGVPKKVPEAAAEKRAWVRHHLGRDIPIICCASRDKSLHARSGDILIDDWEKHQNLWLAAGGRWITHTSAENSIQQLLDMGIGL